MTHLNIADSVNYGIKKLIAVLPEEAAESVEGIFTESSDIAVCLNELTKICMIAGVGDSEKTEALDAAYANDPLGTDACAAAKFMDALIELYKKANPVEEDPGL